MKRYKAEFSVILAGILWGTMSIWVRNMSIYGLTSLQIALCRALFSALAMGIFLAIVSPEKLKICFRDCWMFLGTGVVSLTLFNWCYFTTIRISQASIAVVLLYTSPVWVMLMSGVVFHEKITGLKFAALALTLGGCVLVSGAVGGGYSVPAKVIVIGVASGYFYALYSIFGEVALKKYDPLTVTFYTFVFASLASLFVGDAPALTGAVLQNPVLLLWIAGIGIFATILPYIFYTIGLAGTEPGKAAILATVEPLVGAAIGIGLYREPHNGLKILGMGMIFASVIVLNLKTGGDT